MKDFENKELELKEVKKRRMSKKWVDFQIVWIEQNRRERK